ncbi:MAG: hypothetical protein P4L27_00115 [Ignavibacteriaceae bacterium]|nr:hypothetical protein [Ignavibacteriaceae bacterium]
MNNYFRALLYFVIPLIIGCATVPSDRVSHPWVRSLKSGQNIIPTKSIKIEVNGTTSPLLGNEQLTSEGLSSVLSYLIQRRGFIINDKKYDYLVKLTYNTSRNDKVQHYSSVSSNNAQITEFSTGSGAGSTSGLGVSIARAIGLLASSSSTVATESSDQIISFTHTISIEFINKEGNILWKGESTWDSEELNLINRITPALQLILSDLPSDKTIRPSISEIKETHVVNYYRLECRDVWFTCPALPYRILFDSPVDGTKKSIPGDIQNRNALAAYVDLIQTAEYALPNGEEQDWVDPLDITLWEKVTLGAQYYLGPQKTPVNILIKLTGKSDGYYIDECKIASDEEYSNFNMKLNSWREALSNYYDVYKR